MTRQVSGGNISDPQINDKPAASRLSRWRPFEPGRRALDQADRPKIFAVMTGRRCRMERTPS